MFTLKYYFNAFCKFSLFLSPICMFRNKLFFRTYLNTSLLNVNTVNKKYCKYENKENCMVDIRWLSGENVPYTYRCHKIKLEKFGLENSRFFNQTFCYFFIIDIL